MIIAYGYKRAARDLPDAGAHWLDDRPNKPELRALLDLIGITIRSGDALQVCSTRDLGKRLAEVRRRLAEIGATLEVIGAPEAPAKRRRGRPPAIPHDLPPAPRAALRDLAESGATHEALEREGSRIVGAPLHWWHVRDWYGREFVKQR